MKKGFTLIELLGVLIVLGLIALIIFPNVNKSIKTSKEKLYNQQVELIERNARRWGVQNTYVLPKKGFYYLELNELISGGYITGNDIKDPRNESVMTGCVLIHYEDKNQQYMYEYTSTTCEEAARNQPPNKPNLENGLVPIKWNGSTWIKADSNNPSENQWYDYSKQMWANGVSVTEEYRNVEVGTVIPESAILAYFVWIPRYEYDYTNLGDQYAGGTAEQPGEIKVNFIAGTGTKASNNYKVHPAFTFGEQELEGIWVGKFETTGDRTTPTIKPNTEPLANLMVSTEFAIAQKFSASGNTYGISTSADSHMMKNSEWGAVAYLSQSKYGKYGNANYTGANKEVYINNYWNSATMTGCSAGNPSASQSATCAYTYEKSPEGTGASTTGTIYGVYDMSGGAYEYVMGVYRGNDASSIWGASTSTNFAEFSSAPESKYYDEYTSSTSNQACNGGICYGHALSETASWNSDFANFVYSDRPWFVRGGWNNATMGAGVFESSNGDGNDYVSLSFRVVLL